MASDYVIGSINIQKFGRASLNKKDLQGIASIIRDNKIDILAMQEICNREVLEAIMHTLDGTVRSRGKSNAQNAQDSWFCETQNWGGRWAKPISQIGGKSAEEGYAFVWNKRRIQLPINASGKENEPDIYLNGGKLIRPPFCGRFWVKSCNAEIRLINTHIVFKRIPQDDSEFENEESSANDYQERIREFKVLAKDIYQRVYAKNVGTRQVLTFILGDYNMCLEESGSADIRAVMPNEVRRFEYGNHVVKTIQNQKTTIRGKAKSEPEKSLVGEENLANNYDHFSYEEKLDDSISVNSSRIDAQNLYVMKYMSMRDSNGNNLRNEYEAYRSVISDHLPIIMTVSLTKR